MMKKYKKILLSMIVFLLLMSSCTPPEEIENVLIGTWKYMNYQSGDWEKIIFKEDLTYILVYYDGATYESVSYGGDYVYDEDSFTLKQRYSYDLAFYYTISGDNLIITGGNTYTRQ